MSERQVVGGIFVGGQSRRMGRAKGLLTSPEGTPLVERTRALLAAEGVTSVLVGVRPEYTHLSCVALADEPPGVGPLGGLVALLHHAGDGLALAVACDMPFVSASLLARLVHAPPGPPIVAARRNGRWEPLFARFDAAAVLPIAREHCARGRLSLQVLLEAIGATPLPMTLDEDRQLDDWDTPEDLS